MQVDSYYARGGEEGGRGLGGGSEDQHKTQILMGKGGKAKGEEIRAAVQEISWKYLNRSARVKGKKKRAQGNLKDGALKIVAKL